MLISKTYAQGPNPADVISELNTAMGLKSEIDTPAAIINILVPTVVSIAGIILFLMLLWGGFQMLAGANSSESFEKGKQTVTMAIIGFFIIFASYWIAQILEVMTGINVLGI